MLFRSWTTSDTVFNNLRLKTYGLNIIFCNKTSKDIRVSTLQCQINRGALINRGSETFRNLITGVKIHGVRNLSNDFT